MIHLVIGSYYSLDGPGADIWQALVEGRGRAETLALLEQRYDADPADRRRRSDSLVSRLAEEELLEPHADGAPAPPAGATPASERQPFKEPQLEKYTDMQDFLLVDPIHETDETGWPTRSRPASPVRDGRRSAGACRAVLVRVGRALRGGRRGARQERDLVIAGMRLRLTFAGTAMYDAVFPAFEHLAQPVAASRLAAC